MIAKVLKKNKRIQKMAAKIGDRVTVTIRGPNLVSGTTATSSGTATVGPGQVVSMEGTISEDLGDKWVVELDSEFLGNQRMVISKSKLP